MLQLPPSLGFDQTWNAQSRSVAFVTTNQPFQMRVMVKSYTTLPQSFANLPAFNAQNHKTNITQPMDCAHSSFNERSVRSPSKLRNTFH